MYENLKKNYVYKKKNKLKKLKFVVRKGSKQDHSLSNP